MSRQTYGRYVAGTNTADLDHRLVVLGDSCLDADPEVHRVLTEKVFPRQADVTTIDTWIAEQG